MKFKTSNLNNSDFKKFILKFLFSFFILISSISCNFITEKLTALKEEVMKESPNEDIFVSEEISDNENNFSTENVIFYNKYITATNSVTDETDRIQKSYLSMVPDIEKVKNNKYLTAAFFVSSVDNLSTILKNQNRSLYDDGELSKLKSGNSQMKKDIENSYSELLKNTEIYYETAKKIARYYDSKIYLEDPSLIRTYDEEIKLKYKENMIVADELFSVLESYKPTIKIRNPDDYKSNEEKSVIILLNAYGRILESGEKFHKDFKRWEKGDEISLLKADIEELKNVYESEKNKVMEFDFPEKTKFMKYSFEDYFEKMLTKFIEYAEKFFKITESKNAKEWEYTNAFSTLKSYYNYFVQSYNTNVEVIQTTSISLNIF
ncbi:MAG TPA: hypothetical protein PLG90_07985 [Ignavibacteria bacterium]|nr:hypothetical protein [Ignavibacteria bacterium]